MANRLINGIFRAVEAFLSIALLVVLTEVIIEVSARYIFHTPLPWGAEVSQTLLVWLTFLGAAEACRRNEHMAVRFILEGLPSKKLRKALDLFGKLIMLVFVSVGIWSGWQVVQRTWSMKTTALQIPAGILYLALPAGFLIMALAIVDSLFYRENKEMTEEDDIPATGDWR
jgi:TRAP-type C4-dicarboxylate transport system permease small subunit